MRNKIVQEPVCFGAWSEGSLTRPFRNSNESTALLSTRSILVPTGTCRFLPTLTCSSLCWLIYQFLKMVLVARNHRKEIKKPNNLVNYSSTLNSSCHLIQARRDGENERWRETSLSWSVNFCLLSFLCIWKWHNKSRMECGELRWSQRRLCPKKISGVFTRYSWFVATCYYSFYITLTTLYALS